MTAKQALLADLLQRFVGAQIQRVAHGDGASIRLPSGVFCASIMDSRTVGAIAAENKNDWLVMNQPVEQFR